MEEKIFQARIIKLVRLHDDIISLMRTFLSFNVQKSKATEEQDATAESLKQRYYEFEEACNELYLFIVGAIKETSV
jgi:hypothetical protein